ncbi:zinc finger protein 766 [Manduca sexta]|uniref:Uncharacterized protein n=1 Tax=Manduca sexta TaxID=7130 RepID=A0A922CLB9_MANSE|nr:zinc finger protein 766 [Manduca sexta]KAG6451205.1 hypothetical protein O3G_MSEX007014 [Manduca sexta]
MLTDIRNERDLSLEPEDISEGQYETAICRICLKPGEIPIFDDEDVVSNVVEFGAIQLNENDNLPKHLCEACHLLLEAAVVFRQTAKKTEQILQGFKGFGFVNVSYEGLEYLRVVGGVLAYKTRDTNSYSEFSEHSVSNDLWSDLESKNEDSDDTDNLSSDSASSADIKKEKEYLFVKNYSDEEGDSDGNSIVTEGVKNDTFMIVVHDDENKVNKKTDPFTCSHCEASFKSMGELENHNELEHNIKLTDKVNCAVCKEVVSKSFYKVHMKLHREKYLEKKKTYKKVECKICNKYVTKAYYKQHMKMHGSEDGRAERMRDCTLCKKSISINYYNDHMRRIHKLGPNGEKLHDAFKKRKQKDIQCPVCDKKIKEDKYKNHLAQHGKPPKKYICEHCAKEFIHPSAFKTHCLLHKGEFKYKCFFCPYRAQHVGLLKVHVRTHTGDYNYKCTICTARFITKSNLNQHMQRHKGPGNIKCYECDRMFYRKRNMEEHYKTIHLAVKDVICNLCGKGFSNRDGMLSHQIKIHKRSRLLPRMASYLKFDKEDPQKIENENLNKEKEN